LEVLFINWGSNAIEHELSGIYDVTHGAGLAVIIPHWMKYVYKHDVARFAQFAQRVWEIECNKGTVPLLHSEQIALAGIEKLSDFLGSPKRNTSQSDIVVAYPIYFINIPKL
jgi:alcohol dehydrogenase YqhD (iron-dependent ADH family)